MWEGYCQGNRPAGRSACVFAEGPLRFNFLDYEVNRAGAVRALRKTWSACSWSCLNLPNGRNGEAAVTTRSGGRRQSNWCGLRLMSRSWPPAICRFPTCIAWSSPLPNRRNRCGQPIGRRTRSAIGACSKPDARPKTELQEKDFAVDADFFMLQFPELAGKTRSIIDSTITSMVDVLNRGVLRDLFSGETNITPEAVRDGAIILVDLPVKEFGEVGQFAQVLWKLAFQKSIERRDISDHTRPVFLWEDEGNISLPQTTCNF